MPTRRDFLKALAYSTVALSSQVPVEASLHQEAERPNIVLILADDMGWSDLGCYGGEIDTPHLDSLAARGMRFTQMHNTAKCFPSRACLLTGLYAQQSGMHRRPSTIQNAVTLGEVLQAAGYRTLMSGKHHGTENPFDRGFERYRGLRDGAANYFNPGLPRLGEPEPAQKAPGQRVWCFDDEMRQPYTPEEPDFYSTDYFTHWALDYLDQQGDDERPFFLYLAYTAPHDPLQAWPEDIAKYRGKYLAGYDAVRDARYQRQRELGLIDDSFPLPPPTHQEWQNLSDEQKADQDLRMAVYAAMIDRMDQNIGHLLAKLDEMGVAENTLILFASDNGCSAEVVRKGTGEIGTMTRWASLGGDWANVSNTPFRFFKNYSFEGGICTPLIAYWPRVIAEGGQISSQVGHFIDIMPTLADITGAAYPTEYQGKPIFPMEGESLLPALHGEPFVREKPLFWQWGKGRAVLKDRWKLVVHGDGPWELYDIEQDRTETQNLADQHAGVVSQLDALWQGWYERTAQTSD